MILQVSNLNFLLFQIVKACLLPPANHCEFHVNVETANPRGGSKICKIHGSEDLCETKTPRFSSKEFTSILKANMPVIHLSIFWIPYNPKHEKSSLSELKPLVAHPCSICLARKKGPFLLQNTSPLFSILQNLKSASSSTSLDHSGRSPLMPEKLWRAQESLANRGEILECQI